jgi:transposase
MGWASVSHLETVCGAVRSPRRSSIWAFARGRLIGFFSELPTCVVAMEACCSAHHWGRQLLALGFEVRLIPPAHVKPYVMRKQERRGRCGGDL